jgi:hypothetical protein
VAAVTASAVDRPSATTPMLLRRLVMIAAMSLVGEAAWTVSRSL